MSIDYPVLPLPGTPFATDVTWRYERHTNRRVLSHEVSERPENPHVTRLQILVSDQQQYARGALVRFYAALGPDLYSGRCNYFVTAATTSPSGAQAHKVVMRPWQPPADVQALPPALARRHADAVSTHGENYCLYTAELSLPPDSELGTWHTYLMAQTLNDVPEGTKPELAAPVIGGLPVTRNFVPDGRTTHILYGPTCNIALRPDGEFDVVEDVPPVIG